MATKRNDTFTPSGWNGADPQFGGAQFADIDPVSPSPANSPDNNAGTGLKGPMQFADTDLSGDARFRQNNMIDSNDQDYAGRSSGRTWQRTSVDVSKADRGQES